MENHSICPICGSQLQFDERTKRAKCCYCGYSNAIEASSEEAREQELLRQKKARTKKIRIIVISSTAAVVAAAGVIITTTIVAALNGRIANAISKIEGKDYKAAISELTGISFGESSNLLSMAKAGKSFEAGKFEDGIEFVLAAGGGVEVHYSAENATAEKSGEMISPKAKRIDNPCTPNDGYVFREWRLTQYAITVDDSDYSGEIWLNARVLTLKEAEEEDAWNAAHGVTPIVSSDGAFVTYGLYPQSAVSDPSAIASLDGLASAEPNGWYLLDGDYYAKAVVKPYLSGYTFGSGAAIVGGETYWFKCEPIRWKVLESSGNEAFVVSDVLLDAHRYDDSSNNYADSEIRAWLNDEFYASAFALGDAHVLTTEVDNSAPTTGSSSNSHACGNTWDKVFLLSYADYGNASYGFASDASRQCVPTDFAVARGAYCPYWTRSPDSGYSYYAWYAGTGGERNQRVVYTEFGVRPSLRITLAE